MIAVITGDIIGSRKLGNQGKWLLPLKNLLATWGKSPKDWQMERGDFFQIEIAQPEEALHKMFIIKALIKKIKPIDVRMAVGIGEKTYAAESIAESNGPAFIYSGEKFEVLKKENVTMGIKTPWQDFDEEINLYLKLANNFADNWSVSSAELVELLLKSPDLTQKEIGGKLGIKQNSVSGRWKRAHINALLEVDKMFRKKLKSKPV